MPTTDLYTSKSLHYVKTIHPFSSSLKALPNKQEHHYGTAIFLKIFQHVEESYQLIKHDAYSQIQATEKGVVVHSIMKDQPFIVDTPECISMHLERSVLWATIRSCSKRRWFWNTET